MFKKELLKDERVIYQSLSNAFESHKIAQSYLLDGPSNPQKLKTAFLIAQSIIEDKGGLACEECTTCKRIRNMNYADLFLIDGNLGKIKKDDIEELIARFSLSSIEKENKKVYIINNVNNLAKSENIMVLLKFMEEPPSDNIYGILISDNSAALPDTIVSRCQMLRFHAPSNALKLDHYRALGFDEKEAQSLVKLDFEINELNDEDLLLANDMCDYSYDHLGGPYLAKEFYEKVYNRYKDNQSFDRFLKIYLRKMIDYLLEERNSAALKIFLEFKDDLGKNFDRKLLIEGLCYKLGKIGEY